MNPTTEHVVSSLQGLCRTKCEVVLASWNNRRACPGPRQPRRGGTERKRPAPEWEVTITTLLCRQPFQCVQRSQLCPPPSSHSWTRPCSWTAEMSLVDPVIGTTEEIGGYLHETGVVHRPYHLSPGCWMEGHLGPFPICKGP